MNEQTYTCPLCGKLLAAPEGEAAPVCCGKPMEPVPLPYCVKAPADPEMARTGDADEPCDDGTRPKES